MTPGAGIFRTILPLGFTAGGVNCSVRRYRPDLGIIISEVPCVTTGVFTQNVFCVIITVISMGTLVLSIQ